MRIYSTVQLCSITSLWHSGQHLCRAIGRLHVRISQGFWLLSKKRAHYEVDYCGKKTFLAGLQCTLTSSCAKIAHTHRFEHEPSGLKSKHLTTIPRTPELCELRAETRELSRGKKAPALSHNTCLSQV